MGRKSSEFERIERFFAPLAEGFPGAFGLSDDAAVITPPAGRDLVVTTDTVVAGVHFEGGEPPGLVAAKLLRVNLSDLASMGAAPLAYTLNIALPDAIGDDWLEDFAVYASSFGYYAKPDPSGKRAAIWVLPAAIRKHRKVE